MMAPNTENLAPADRPAIAFDGERLLASGPFGEVARAVRTAQGETAHGVILVFDAESGEQLDVDPRSGASATSAKPQAAAAISPDVQEPSEGRGPGRPKLGVIAREVTLLPRHWEWLASQPGGASATLRRLVEQARGATTERDRVRRAQEAAYRFMAATLGNQAHFEEAIRALFAGDRGRFTTLTEAWPRDLRDHARTVAANAFPPPLSSPTP